MYLHIFYLRTVVGADVVVVDTISGGEVVPPFVNCDKVTLVKCNSSEKQEVCKLRL